MHRQTQRKGGTPVPRKNPPLGIFSSTPVGKIQKAESKERFNISDTINISEERNNQRLYFLGATGGVKGKTSERPCGWIQKTKITDTVVGAIRGGEKNTSPRAIKKTGFCTRPGPTQIKNEVFTSKGERRHAGSC